MNNILPNIYNIIIIYNLLCQYKGIYAKARARNTINFSRKKYVLLINFRENCGKILKFRFEKHRQMQNGHYRPNSMGAHSVNSPLKAAGFQVKFRKFLKIFWSVWMCLIGYN